MAIQNIMGRIVHWHPMFELSTIWIAEALLLGQYIRRVQDAINLMEQ